MELQGITQPSFGAFATPGVRSSSRGWPTTSIAAAARWLRAEGDAARESSHHVLLGNVALYGATAGRLLAAGSAPASLSFRRAQLQHVAVVEGVGDRLRLHDPWRCAQGVAAPGRLGAVTGG